MPFRLLPWPKWKHRYKSAKKDRTSGQYEDIITLQYRVKYQHISLQRSPWFFCMIPGWFPASCEQFLTVSVKKRAFFRGRHVFPNRNEQPDPARLRHWGQVPKWASESRQKIFITCGFCWGPEKFQNRRLRMSWESWRIFNVWTSKLLCIMIRACVFSISWNTFATFWIHLQASCANEDRPPSLKSWQFIILF